MSQKLSSDPPVCVSCVPVFPSSTIPVNETLISVTSAEVESNELHLLALL